MRHRLGTEEVFDEGCENGLPRGLNRGGFAACSDMIQYDDGMYDVRMGFVHSGSFEGERVSVFRLYWIEKAVKDDEDTRREAGLGLETSQFDVSFVRCWAGTY